MSEIDNQDEDKELLNGTGSYDELDEQIIDALTVDPRVQWSFEQRKAVKQLITQKQLEARIEELKWGKSEQAGNYELDDRIDNYEAELKKQEDK